MHCLVYLWWCPANNQAAWCCREKKSLAICVMSSSSIPCYTWSSLVCGCVRHAAAAVAAAECLLQLQELGCSAEHMQGGVASMSSELNQILLKQTH